MKSIIALSLLILNLHSVAYAKSNEILDKNSKESREVKSEDSSKNENLNSEIQSQPMTKLVKINGMVCAFCVDNLKKVFLKNKAVKNIDIDLDTKLLTLQLKPNFNMTDSEIKKSVKNAGYAVESITNQ